MTKDATAMPVELTIENIGGITETTKTFTSGLTLLTGENASNRSSLLRGLRAAVGSTNVSLRTGADRGRAVLDINGTTHSVTITRMSEGDVRIDGDPLINDPHTVQAAEIFAFLLEDNPIRQAIRADADEMALRDVLMRPIDTADLERQLSEVRTTISNLEDEHATLEHKASKLSELRDRRSDLKTQQADLDERLDDLRAEIEHIEVDAEAAAARDDEVSSLRAELTEAHDNLTDIKTKRESEQQRIENLRRQRDELREQLDTLALPDADEGELEEHRTEVANQLNAINRELDRIDNLIEINEAYLTTDDRTHDTIVDEVAQSNSGSGAKGGGTESTSTIPSSPTEALSKDTCEETVCWTCGQRVAVGRIETMLGDLHDAHRRLVDRRNTLKEELNDTEAKLGRLRDKRDERTRLEQQLATIKNEIEEAEQTIAEFEGQIEDHEERVAEIESRLKEASLSDRHERLLELHDDLGAKQQQRDNIERELEAVEADIKEAEEAVERLDNVEAELEAKKQERDELKNRVRDRETAIVETFNEHMETVIEALEFDLERVWLERRVPDAGETDSGPYETSVFKVQVARKDDDNTVHADSIAKLSESEREVIGLIVALTGYLVHEVHEDMPVLVLDAVEAIDSNRLAALLDYFDSYAEITIAAVLHAHTETADLDVQADNVIVAEQPQAAD